MNGGFTADASVCPTNHATILSAIVTKLRADIPDVFGSETTCFISDIAWPGIEVHDEVLCTVHPADSEFESEGAIGGGRQGIIENGVFRVTVWSKHSVDRIEHTVYALTDATRGILGLKKRVLQSLAGQQIYSDALANETPLLITCMRPLSATHPPSRQGDAEYTSFSIAFLGQFYWDLT
jgi:hypothetical protein